MNDAVAALRRGPVAARLREARLVAVLRRIAPRAALLDLVDDLVAAGVRAVEVTWDAPSAADDLATVRDRVGRDVLVGAGTLLTPDQVAAAADAGAAFGVAPVFHAGAVRAAVERGLPFLPGALTPTEIVAAWDAGATFVKLFPASAVGPGFVRELRGPLPEVELVPTGGVDAASAPAFLEAGAAAVGIGGSLVRGSAEERRRIVAAVRAAAA